MEDNPIIYPYITEYLRELIPRREGFPGELEQWARREGYPIVRPETAGLLEVLCIMKNPRSILEIGTAVGFSALLMAACCPAAKITTIDRYAHMIGLAKKHFAESPYRDRITLLEGDAAGFLPGLEGGYQLIFLDAAKAQYIRFLPHCVRLLEDGGILVADNILCGGIVAGRPFEGRRDKTTVKRMNEFLTALYGHPRLTTSVLPVGDGVSLSVKRPG